MKKIFKINFNNLYEAYFLRKKNLFLIFLLFFFPPSKIFAENFSIGFPKKVNFHYYASFLKINGFLKVTENNFNIDFKNPEKSKIYLKLDINNSEAGFPLATYFMKSPEILYTDKHPFGYFESTRIIKKKIF